MRALEGAAVVAVLAVTALSGWAVALAIVGGVMGIASLFVVAVKLRQIETVTGRQEKAVADLHAKVDSIEGMIKGDDAGG